MFPDSCTLYSDAPSAVARMHSPAGSSGNGKRPASRRSRIGAAEPAAEIAEVALLAAVDVFAHAAREHRARDAAQDAKRLGQPQTLNVGRRWILREQRHQRIGHPRR